MRDVGLAVLAEVSAVVVDHRGGVVVDAFLLELVDRDDEGDVMLARQVLHQPDGGAVGDRLGEIVPAGGLLGAEVRAVEDLLQADDLRAGFRGLPDVIDVLVDHGLLGGFERSVRRRDVGGLNQRAADISGHWVLGNPAIISHTEVVMSLRRAAPFALAAVFATCIRSQETKPAPELLGVDTKLVAPGGATLTAPAGLVGCQRTGHDRAPAARNRHPPGHRGIGCGRRRGCRGRRMVRI